MLSVAALGYIGLVDPHNPNSIFPQCPFKLITGWNCPVCGGLRMTHDLLHGDLAAAATDNAFLLGGWPILAGWMLLRRYRGRPLLPIPAVVLLAVLAIAWTVLRNLPGGLVISVAALLAS
ncbi:MAG: DUF2752 domain-containing protein [Mycobacteriaceae bacterium]|nr:DUF2752 domain-containing protein [Mycobacteriaceae bacterium]